MGIALSALHNTIKTLSSVINLLRALSDEFNQALNRASQSPGLPNPKPSQTYWLSDPPFPELVNVRSPELPCTADVAIIGSGIAGAAIARSLLHERRHRNADKSGKVIVLEARELSSGATARNGGHIKPTAYESFSRFSKILPKDRAAALTRFQMQHVECLVSLCQGQGIDAAEARKVETVDLFFDNQTFQKAVKDVTEVKKWLPEVDITVWDRQEAQEVCRSLKPINIRTKLMREEIRCQRQCCRCFVLPSRCYLGIPFYRIYLEGPSK
jgi:hypothetical protein